MEVSRMRDKADYAIEGVLPVPRQDSMDAPFDDPVPQFDNTEAFKEQLKQDKFHPAYGLDKKADADD